MALLQYHEYPNQFALLKSMEIVSWMDDLHEVDYCNLVIAWLGVL